VWYEEDAMSVVIPRPEAWKCWVVDILLYYNFWNTERLGEERQPAICLRCKKVGGCSPSGTCICPNCDERSLVTIDELIRYF